MRFHWGRRAEEWATVTKLYLTGLPFSILPFILSGAFTNEPALAIKIKCTIELYYLPKSPSVWHLKEETFIYTL